MTTFEIIEAKPYHCGQMVRALRHDHRAAVLKLGLNAHRQLRACYDDSAFCRAWIIDGKLAGLGGVTGTEASFSGYIWLALTEEATRYPKMIVKEARNQLNEIMSVKRRLLTTLVDADPTSRRFAEYLGFHALERVSDWAIAMEYQPLPAFITHTEFEAA